MVEAKRVIWPQKVRTQLRELYKYIKRDSPMNAEKVRKDILASTRELSKDFKLHQPDKYKEDNDGSYRAYEIHRCRIAYHVGEGDITIVRVRHVSMEPTRY